HAPAGRATRRQRPRGMALRVVIGTDLLHCLAVMDTLGLCGMFGYSKTVMAGRLTERAPPATAPRPDSGPRRSGEVPGPGGLPVRRRGAADAGIPPLLWHSAGRSASGRSTPAACGS